MVGIPIALTWAYYPTEGRLYTNSVHFVDGADMGQGQSAFYGTPIHLWIQVCITFGAVLLASLLLSIRAILVHSKGLLAFAGDLFGVATVPWLPVLLYIDDINAFAVLANSKWKRKVLAALSVIFRVGMWCLLSLVMGRFVGKGWGDKDVKFEEEYSYVVREDSSARPATSMDVTREPA